ncbi:hypothetical protein [Acidisoma sp. C75]
MNSRILRGLVPGLVLGLGFAAALPAERAAAQAALPQPTAMGPVVQGANNGPKAQPSVAGLPGASPTAPIKQSPIDASLLSPTTELFDAINRGDVTAARDALARGADLNARDAVGQTPVDVSIQLGRNAITFLLVTMMKANGSDYSEPQGPMAQPPANTLGMSEKDLKATTTPVSFLNPSAAKKGATRPQATTLAARGPAPAPGGSAYAASYGGGSGAAVPSAGFVGFGGTAQ